MESMATKQVGEQQSTECTESIKSTDSAIVLASTAAGGTGTVTMKTKYGVVDPNFAMVLDVIMMKDEKRDRRDEERERRNEERERKNEERERVREQRMVDIVEAVVGRVTNIQSAVQELQENCQKPVDTTYAPFFRTERLKKMMQVVPVLCDGKLGIAAYMPAEHEGAMYVVVSIGIMDALMQAYVNGNTSVADVLRANVETVTVDADMFRSLMLKTVFKPYKKGPKMKESNWLKNNMNMYMIVKEEWFKGLIEEIRERCDVPDEFPESLEAIKLHMTQSFSRDTHFSAGRNVYESMGSNFEVDDSRLASMPVFGLPWTIEAYQMGCVDYFGMKEVDGKLGVIMSGRFKEPHTDSENKEVYARPYERFLAGIRKHSWYLFDMDVIEASPQLFPEEAMESVRGEMNKKKGSGKRKKYE